MKEENNFGAFLVGILISAMLFGALGFFAGHEDYLADQRLIRTLEVSNKEDQINLLSKLQFSLESNNRCEEELKAKVRGN